MLDLWSWHGRVGRKHYLATGLILLFLKHNIDRTLAAIAGYYPWSPLSYWVFISRDGVRSLEPADARFYVVLLIFAIPFMWIGTMLTLRRLRDADLPLWLVMLFYVPFLNVIFFAVLTAIPSRQPGDEVPKLGSRVGRFIPQSGFGSAAFGIAITALLAVI